MQKYYPHFLTRLASLLKGNTINDALLAKLNYYLRKERFEILSFRIEEKEYIPAFETWIKQTDDHLLHSRWLFWNYYDCPDDRLIHVDDNGTDEETLTSDIRKDAFKKIWSQFGIQGVQTLLSQMEDIYMWGKFLANVLLETNHTEIANTLLQLNKLRILQGFLMPPQKRHSTSSTTIFLWISACKYTAPCREWMWLIGYQQKKKSKHTVLENR